MSDSSDGEPFGSGSLGSSGFGSSSRPDAKTEHRQPVGSAGWSEHHRLFVIADGPPSTRMGTQAEGRSLALALQIGIHRAPKSTPLSAPEPESLSESLPVSALSASFYCVVLRAEEDPLVIVESEIEAPERLWEFRTSGLWADTICETPYVHWSYGLEAFALAIEDPEEMLGRGYGDRVPLGWELEFESEPDLVIPDGSANAFSQTGQAHGLLLLAAGVEVEFAGRALRQHWWGDDAAAALPTLDGRVGLLDVASSQEVRAEVTVPLTPSGRWNVARTDAGIRSVSHSS